MAGYPGAMASDETYYRGVHLYGLMRTLRMGFTALKPERLPLDLAVSEFANPGSLYGGATWTLVELSSRAQERKRPASLRILTNRISRKTPAE